MMEQYTALTNEDILSLPKETAGGGTFVLSLRDETEFFDVHPTGYHCIPHIGTYGQEYRLTSPILLVSLPTTPRYIRCLPIEVLRSLGLDHLSSDDSATNLIASPATTALDKPQSILPTLGDPPLRCLARKLAWGALLSAYDRIAHGTRQVDDIADQLEAMIIGAPQNLQLQPTMKSGSAVSLMSHDGPASSSSAVSFTDYVQSSPRAVPQRYDKTYDEELRITSKKLINKVLHFACKAVDSLYRRSSIEYLIASAKRMKISESPPPPSLVLANQPDSFQFGRRSPSPEARVNKLGAKRQRSNSHDIAMLSSQTENKKLILGQKAVVGSERRQILRVRQGASPVRQMTPPFVPTSLSHTSIVEESESDSEHVESEPEHLELESEHLESESDESFTVLEAVEKRVDVMTPSIVVSQPCDAVLDMDMYVIIHSYPPPSQCQKFLCSNTNEVNLVYHCWLYRDSPFSPELTLTRKLEMGLFCPQGVEPVHLDLQDAGIPFQLLDERTVCIHECCFSPENAQLKLTMSDNRPPLFHSFYSVACHGSRRVVAYHVIPGNPLVEHLLSRSVQDCFNLKEVLLSLSSTFTDLGEQLASLLLPLD